MAPRSEKNTTFPVRLADPETLKPYEKNPRVISQAAIDKVLASIREFGWRQPIVVDEDGVILVGHTRRLAAIKGGYKSVPVHDALGLSEAQKKAYRLADNRTGEESEWDLPALRGELSDLRALLPSLDLTGFGASEIFELFGSPESANDPSAEWAGMPEFEHVDKTAYRSVVVHFKDEAAVQKFAKLVKQKITDRTRFLWYPEIEIETYADKQYKKRT